MNEKILFEDMPPSAQKAYTMTNTVRKAAMFIGWVSVALFAILYFITEILKSGASAEDGAMILLVSFLGMMLLGLVHGEFWFKKAIGVFNSFGMTIVFFEIPLILCGLVFLVFGYGSGIFLIIDTILFIKKKPLVYKFEHHYFMESKAAQAEVSSAVYSQVKK